MAASDLRQQFELADKIPPYTIDVYGQKYTFWSGVRASLPAAFAQSSTMELMQAAEEAVSRGLIEANEIGKQPPILENVVVVSDRVIGNLNKGTVRVFKNAELYSLDSIEYLIDERGDIFEIGSRRQAASQHKESKLRISPVYFLCGLVLAAAVSTYLHQRPFSAYSPDYYYYSEASMSITRRNADGSLDTRTSREVRTNLDLARGAKPATSIVFPSP